MFRKEGLEEIKSDIERAKDIHSLKGIATAMVATTEHASAEIDRLKAELELRDAIIQEATHQMVANEEGDIFIRSISQEFFVGTQENKPKLYAHLAGRGE